MEGVRILMLKIFITNRRLEIRLMFFYWSTFVGQLFWKRNYHNRQPISCHWRFFYIPWKNQKTSDFLMFSGDIKEASCMNWVTISICGEDTNCRGNARSCKRLAFWLLHNVQKKSPSKLLVTSSIGGVSPQKFWILLFF